MHHWDWCHGYRHIFSEKPSTPVLVLLPDPGNWLWVSGIGCDIIPENAGWLLDGSGRWMTACPLPPHITLSLQIIHVWWRHTFAHITNLFLFFYYRNKKKWLTEIMVRKPIIPVTLCVPFVFNFHQHANSSSTSFFFYHAPWSEFEILLGSTAVKLSLQDWGPNRKALLSPDWLEDRLQDGPKRNVASGKNKNHAWQRNWISYNSPAARERGMAIPWPPGIIYCPLDEGHFSLSPSPVINLNSVSPHC